MLRSGTNWKGREQESRSNPKVGFKRALHRRHTDSKRVPRLGSYSEAAFYV